MTAPKLYQFTINDKIGQKLCYTLYDATDQTNNRRVFLKVLDEKLSRHENHVYNFLSHAKILQSMDNPNICRIYHYGGDLGNYYIATEAVDFEPISSLIQNEFSLSVEHVIEIFSRIGKTLRQAHLNGVIHGALNPNNIFIDSDGSIKIDDLGMSWYVRDILKVSNEESLHLAQYIAPDFYKPNGKIDGRVDLYSLGIILIQMLTGQPPFAGSSLLTIQDLHKKGDLPDLNSTLLDVPEELETIVQRSVNPNSERRFHNFKEYVDTLERLKKQVLRFSYSQMGSYQEKEEFSYVIAAAKDYFTTEDEPDEPIVETKAPSVVMVQGGKILSGLGTIVTSRNFILSGVALLVILSLVFIGSNEFPLPFDPHPDSEMTSTGTESPLVSGVQPPDMFPRRDEASGHDREATDIVDRTPADLDGKGPVLALNRSESLNPMTSPESKDLVKPRGTRTTGVESRNEPSKAKKATKTTADRPTTVNDKVKAGPKPAAQENEPTRANVVTAKLRVRSNKKPLEAFVFIDDKFRGKADENGSLELSGLAPNKSYTARISKEGYTTVSRRFTTRQNPVVLAFDLRPKLDISGTVILDVQPKADSILVDGKLYREQTPFELTLPWGEHRVRFVNNRLNKSWDQVVNLKVGQVLRVKHNFAQAEFGKVAVSVKNAAEFGFGYLYVDGKPWPGKPNTTPVQISLPVGLHTIEIRRDGFNAIPRDIIMVVAKQETKYVSFTLTKDQ